MNKRESLEMERLKRLLEAERERVEKLWTAYRDTLYELVDAKMKLEAVAAALIMDIKTNEGAT